MTNDLKSEERACLLQRRWHGYVHYAFLRGFVISNRCTKVVLFHNLLEHDLIRTEGWYLIRHFQSTRKGFSRMALRAKRDGVSKISHLETSFEKLLSIYLVSIYPYIYIHTHTHTHTCVCVYASKFLISMSTCFDRTRKGWPIGDTYIHYTLYILYIIHMMLERNICSLYTMTQMKRRNMLTKIRVYASPMGCKLLLVAHVKAITLGTRKSICLIFLIIPNWIKLFLFLLLFGRLYTYKKE